MVYLFKQGSWYPFAPIAAQDRNNELEPRVRSFLGTDLPMEKDLSRWMALWGLLVNESRHCEPMWLVRQFVPRKSSARTLPTFSISPTTSALPMKNARRTGLNSSPLAEKRVQSSGNPFKRSSSIGVKRR